MIIKQKVISNENVTVSFSFTHSAISITNTNTDEMRIFMGWDELPDLFSCYWNNFNEFEVYQDAIKYFTRPEVKRFSSMN